MDINGINLFITCLLLVQYQLFSKNEGGKQIPTL